MNSFDRYDFDEIAQLRTFLLNDFFIFFQLSQARANATEAFKRAEQASQQANAYLNETISSINYGNELISNLTEISQNNTASPKEIEDLAKEVSATFQFHSIY